MSSWGVVVAAGGVCDDALAKRIGSPRKALARFGGRTSLEWTLDAIREAGLDSCVTVGGSDLDPHVTFGKRVDEVGSAVDNSLAAAERLECSKLLLLPADSPLLRGEMILSYLEEVDARVHEQVWYSAGLCSESAFRAEYPGARTSPLRLREGPFLSGAFYATNHKSLVQGRELFQAMRRSRKNKLAMALKFGIGSAIRFFLRQFSVAEAEQRLSRVLEAQVVISTSAHPASILDFDDVASVDLIEPMFAQA